jgi:D-alanyl-lipoteichoic acid acyltransferase DltB (MBOAT superfamily)
MVFHSLVFLLAFIPISITIFWLAAKFFGQNGTTIFLLIASLTFYGFGGSIYLIILCVSLIVNYSLYLVMRTMHERGSKIHTAWLLRASILFNILYLFYFKYLAFFSDIVSDSTGYQFETHVLFPVGISFYTFIQIGFHISEIHNRFRARISFLRYFLFGSFFPYVTAGPLITRAEYEASLRETHLSPSLERAIPGILLFIFGLSKKVLIADTLAPYVNQVFIAVSFKEPIGFIMALIGTLGYTLQLYFDFSGYSDMALGVALIFGIYLPLNFFSPLKATNIVDFWRRWHITMTRFFTNYVYTPIALSATRAAMLERWPNTKKFIRVTIWPSIITFLCAGVWHGAGWNFFIFGLIHGLAIATYHSWSYFKMPRLKPWVSRTITISTFAFSLIFFRSETPGDALYLISQLFSYPTPLNLDTLILTAMVVVLFIFVLIMPNTREILKNHKLSADEVPEEFHGRLQFSWKPTIPWLMIIALLAIVATLLSVDPSPFIYYKF